MKAHRLFVGICLFCLVLGTGLYADAARENLKVLGENCFIVEQRCLENIRRTEWGFEYSGMKFGQAEKGGVVRIDTDIIEHVTNVAILLDTIQAEYCSQIQSMTECLTSRDKVFAQLYSCQVALQQLVILGQSYSEKRLRARSEIMKWVVRSSFLLEKLEAQKLLPQKIDTALLKAQVNAAVDFVLNDMTIERNSEKYTELLVDPFLARITQVATQDKAQQEKPETQTGE